MNAGEEFHDVLEEIVSMANRLQVRRRSFEQIEEAEQWKLIGELGFLRDHFRDRVEQIDRRLTEILDRKMGEA